jgi:hypothetical protein
MKKKMIPYEFISDLKSEEPIMLVPKLRDDDKEKLKKILLYKFQYNIEKSTSYYIKLLNVRKKIKENNVLKNRMKYDPQEEIFRLCFKLFYIKAMCIIAITENIMKDISLKNIILSEYIKIKKAYEIEISKHNN